MSQMRGIIQPSTYCDTWAWAWMGGGGCETWGVLWTWAPATSTRGISTEVIHYGKRIQRIDEAAVPFQNTGKTTTSKISLVKADPLHSVALTTSAPETNGPEGREQFSPLYLAILFTELFSVVSVWARGGSSRSSRKRGRRPPGLAWETRTLHRPKYSYLIIVEFLNLFFCWERWQGFY